MASMDFAYDLIEKLSEEPDNDYLILILRKGKKHDKVDLFYRFDQESKETLEIVHKRIGKILMTMRKNIGRITDNMHIEAQWPIYGGDISNILFSDEPFFC